MRIAILGGLGFVGTNLYLKLKNKHRVKIYDNFTIKGNLKFFKKKDVNYCDITNKNKLKKILNNKFDIIINLAGQTGVVESNIFPEKSILNNIIGFHNLLAIYKNNKKIKIINASTAGAIYGDTNKLCDEKNIANPISFYGLTKKFNEDQGYLMNKFYNIHIVNLRFSNIYGEYSIHKKSLIHNSFKKILKKKSILISGNGNQTRDFIYVGDIVDLIIKSFSFKAGTYNLASGKSYSIKLFLKIIKNFNKEIKIKNIKKNLGEVKNVKINNNKLLREVKKSFKFTKFDLGLKKTFNWYKNFFNPTIDKSG